ncbi:hypothetical protein XH80_28725 [Bradyrhizobium sp. CCBAU 45384]|nr:hypothetical protein [Bradyrhizobium sp. CCBAU 45384]
MRRALTSIAIETGAIRIGEDGETLASCFKGEAERHAYAKATLLSLRGRWPCPIEDVRETLRSVLDEARWGDRYVERYQYTF